MSGPYGGPRLFVIFVFSSLLASMIVAAAAAQPIPGVSVVAAGFDRPVDIASAGDERLFVVEQSGVIKILEANGNVAAQPFLDIRAKVTTAGTEQGLFGLAFHPDYSENGYFYVSYSALDGATVIARYQLSADDAEAGDPASERIILRIEQPSAVHKGGDLNFGPQGLLYIAVGDGGRPGSSHDGQSLLGKLLRIDVDNGTPYAIPPDNPFVDNPQIRDEIWAVGLRNPFRFSFDGLTGDLFVADVGESDREEINQEAAGNEGGKDYGWPCSEGSLERSSDCQWTAPIYEYAHETVDVGDGTEAFRCSVIGGFVYRGSESPMISGHYFFADWCSGELWALAETADGLFGLQYYGKLFPSFSVATFGEDANGELYLGGLVDGVIYKLRPGLLVPAGEFVPLGANLTVTKTGDGQGTVQSETPGIDCGSICKSRFPINEKVKLTAIPDSRSSFEGWDGACSTSELVTMDAPKQCVAVFEELPVDNFLCYTTRPHAKISAPVSLVDPFEEKDYELKKSTMLCNPADVNEAGISNVSAHLHAYQIKRLNGEPRSPVRSEIRVENQFGILFVDTKQPDRLLVPAAKSLDTDPAPLDRDSKLDHFKCYEIKSVQGFRRGLQATAVDQFAQRTLYDIRKPQRLCNPVNKNGEGIKNDEEENHLLCYKIRRAKRQPKHIKVRGITVLDQFGAIRVETKKVKELCVPSTVEASP